ncbi:hypothetical protein Tco_1308719, partial [Tanacetum coccineum]
YEARVSRFGRENGGGTKFDKSNNKASSSNDSLVATKGVEDEGMESFSNLSEASGNTSLTLLADKIRDIESLMLEVKLMNENIIEDVVGGTSNTTDTRMQVDFRQNTNDNSLSSFAAVLDDVNKTQVNFYVLTTPASSKCEVLIPRSSVNDTPPRCDSCNSHTNIQCLKNVIVSKPNVALNNDQRDGFTDVRRKGTNNRRREKDAKRVENVTTMTNIATPIDVGPQANDKQTHTLPTKSKDGKHTPTLYESWKETLDDDYDPYDDDVYNANCLSEDQEALCNALDIKFCGCMKKWIIFGVVLSQMLSAMHLEDRPLKFSAITYYSNVTWCLGALGSDAWYLEVAKPFLVDPNV